MCVILSGRVDFIFKIPATRFYRPRYWGLPLAVRSLFSPKKWPYPCPSRSLLWSRIAKRGKQHRRGADWRLSASSLLAYFGIRWLILGSVLGGTPRVSIIDWARDGAKAVAKFGMTDIWWLGIALVIGSAGIFIYQRGRNISHKDRPFTLLLICLLVASLAPALGHLHNWYLYLPSAFFCIGISAIWLTKKQPVLCALFAILILYYGAVIGREGFFWRETSQMSENAIANLMPHARATTGTLFVCNVPSAWTPPNAFSGKPLFAYALKNALAMRSSQPFTSRNCNGEPRLVDRRFYMSHSQNKIRVLIWQLQKAASFRFTARDGDKHHLLQ